MYFRFARDYKQAKKKESINSAIRCRWDYKTLISWLYEKELDCLEYDIILEYIDKQTGISAEFEKVYEEIARETCVSQIIWNSFIIPITIVNTYPKNEKLLGKTTGEFLPTGTKTKIEVRWSDHNNGNYTKKINPRFNCKNFGNNLFKTCIEKGNYSVLDHLIRIVEDYIDNYDGKNSTLQHENLLSNDSDDDFDQIFSQITKLAITQVDGETKIKHHVVVELLRKVERFKDWFSNYLLRNLAENIDLLESTIDYLKEKTCTELVNIACENGNSEIAKVLLIKRNELPLALLHSIGKNFFTIFLEQAIAENTWTALLKLITQDNLCDFLKVIMQQTKDFDKFCDTVAKEIVKISDRIVTTSSRSLQSKYFSCVLHCINCWTKELGEPILLFLLNEVNVIISLRLELDLEKKNLSKIVKKIEQQDLAIQEETKKSKSFLVNLYFYLLGYLSENDFSITDEMVNKCITYDTPIVRKSMRNLIVSLSESNISSLLDHWLKGCQENSLCRENISCLQRCCILLDSDDFDKIKIAISSVVQKIVAVLQSKDNNLIHDCISLLNNILEFSKVEYSEILKNFNVHDDNETVTEVSFKFDYSFRGITDDFPNSVILTKSVVETIKNRLSTANRLPLEKNEVTSHDGTGNLVQTKTVIANLNYIQSLIDTNTPIILEGDTGAGKTAIIQECANLNSKTLIRFNMSAQTTEEDLIGKVSMDKSKQLVFTENQFTKAFVNGDWLLLDELNLASDSVLQVIESCLDRGVITYNDPSDSEEPMKMKERHPNFRLFATQNPGSGLFAGKREKLSLSFLDRFTPVIFDAISEEDCSAILTDKFKKMGFENCNLIQDVVEKLVRFHFKVSKLKHSEKNAAYGVTSIRELIKLADHLEKAGIQNMDIYSSQYLQLICWEAWCVYGSRYRSDGRDKVLSLFNKLGWSTEELTNVDWEQNILDDEFSIKFGDFCSTTVQLQPMTIFKSYIPVNAIKGVAIEKNSKLYIEDIHHKFYKFTLKQDFIIKYGLYFVKEKWACDWQTSSIELNNKNEIILHGAKQYASRFRSDLAKKEIFDFFKQFVSNDFNFDYSLDDCDQNLLCLPFVITQRIKELWKQIIHSIDLCYPMLIIGSEGCGKSEAVRALAYLLNKHIHTLCITPETETSAIIGQYIPKVKVTNDEDEGTDDDYFVIKEDEYEDESIDDDNFVKWCVGVVSEAFDGDNPGWALLDNLNQAQSEVLERLNPILEVPSSFILVEKGEHEPKEQDDDFRFIGTITPSSQKSEAAAGAELSPAFYNRFTSILMPNISSVNRKICKDEIISLINIIAGEENTEYLLDLCMLMLYDEKLSQTKVTLRNIVRLLDCAYKLKLQFRTLDLSHRIWSAYHLTFGSQIKDPHLRSEVDKEVMKILGPIEQVDQFKFVNLYVDISNSSAAQSHVLTHSRKLHAEVVLGCIQCNYPILIEGPPAVGKTALITALVQWINLKHERENKTPMRKLKLERVNNTQTTSVQDYIGSYLPDGENFVFKAGALKRAMEEGNWFLADEFNLAEPAVLNMLFPLLEGKNCIRIPGNDEIIEAHPNFRFFATQNDSSFANRHELSHSLRNRFVEIQVEDFEQDELCKILVHRKDDFKIPAANYPKDTEDNLKVAKKISGVYTALRKNPGSNITTRELIRWLRRGKLLQNWDIVGSSLLEPRQATISTYQSLLKGALESNEFDYSQSYDAKVTQEEDGENVRFEYGKIFVRIPGSLEKSNLWKNKNYPPQVFVKHLVLLALACYFREPILLIGPTSMKTLLVQTFSQICGRDGSDFITVYLTPETESTDLIGEIFPFSFLEVIQSIKFEYNNFVARSKKLFAHSVNKELIDGLELIDGSIGTVDETIDDICEKYVKQEQINNNEDESILEESNTEQQDDEYGAFGTDQYVENDPYYHSDSLEEDDDTDGESDIYSSSYTTDDDGDDVGDSKTKPGGASDTDSSSSEDLVNNDSDSSTDREKIGNAFEKRSLNVKITTLKQNRTMKEIITRMQNVLNLGFDENEKTDALEQILSSIRQSWNLVKNFYNEKTPTRCFKFREGPVTKAVKLGSLLYLEDFDLPSQAVTERLNSLLESDPSFAVTENITISGENSTTEIKVPDSFQFIASIHQDFEYSKLNLSPAALSRFTVIRVPAYSDDDIKSIVKSELEQRLLDEYQDDIHLATEIIFQFYSVLKKQTIVPVPPLGAIFRWVDFIVNHDDGNSNIVTRVVQGSYFFCGNANHNQFCDILNVWINNNANSLPDKFKFDWLSLFTYNEKLDFFSISNSVIRLSSSNITLRSSSSSLKELDLIFTETVWYNFMRIMSAIACGDRTAVILEGPPGVGKTAAVENIAKLLNIPCERVNLSANTTKEELFGSVIPKYKNGKQIFGWEDGPVMKAIRKQSWILFDEINLAPPELLNTLTPLLQRNINTYTDPQNNDLPLDNCRIFATMNPSSCGSRYQLPRSISNLFSMVLVQDYSVNEIYKIFHKICEKKEILKKGLISSIMVKKIMELHDSITKSKVLQSFNLRDLMKLADLIFENSADQLTSLKYIQKVDISNICNDEYDERDVRLLGLRKFLELVYASGISNPNSKKLIIEMIDAKFPFSNPILDNTIQKSESMIRIGSVYLRRGDYVHKMTDFVETKTAISQLELIALGSQSKRGVLLEGDTASGKTTLVMKLAQLAGRSLEIITLNKNTETSDLIGQWVPKRKSDKVEVQFDEETKSFMKFFLSLFVEADSASDLTSTFGDLHKDLKSVEKIEDKISVVKKILQIIEDRKNNSKPATTYSKLGVFKNSFTKLKTLLECNKDEQGEEQGFIFVQSRLLDAMQEGKWVLLDNVNCAPQEVVERLLSLFEEKPSLTVYEGELTKKKFTRKNGGIDENFRLFLTSNPERIYTNKLSTPLLNRVIRIWIDPLDFNLYSDIDDSNNIKMCDSSHDLLKIVQHKMGHISGGADLAKLCLDFHAYMKRLVELNQISFIDGFTLSARSVLRICDSICSTLKRTTNLNPLSLTIDTLYKFHTATVSISDKKMIETELITRAKNFETNGSSNNLVTLRAKNKLSHYFTVVLNIFLVKLLTTLDKTKNEMGVFEFYFKIRQKLISVVIPDSLSKKLVTTFDEIKQEIKEVLDELKNSQKELELESTVQELANILFEYVKDASFTNSRKRYAYLKQIFGHFRTWKTILFNMEEKFGKDSHFEELFKWFNYLNVRAKLLHWLALPAHDNFTSSIGRIRELATSNQFSGLAHWIDAGLSECIRRCDVISLINLLEASVKKNVKDLSQEDIEILNCGKIMIAAIKASWDYLATLQEPNIILDSSISTFLPPIKLLEELRVLKAIIDCKSVENIFDSEDWNNQNPTVLQNLNIEKDNLQNSLKDIKKNKSKEDYEVNKQTVKEQITNCKTKIKELQQKKQNSLVKIKEKISNIFSSEDSFNSLLKVLDRTSIIVHNKICGILTNESFGKGTNYNFSLPFSAKFATIWNDPLTEHLREKKIGFFWLAMFFSRPSTVPLCSVAILCNDGNVNSKIFTNNNPTVIFIREKYTESWKIMIFRANYSPTLIEWDDSKCEAVKNVFDTYRKFELNSKRNIKKVAPISDGNYPVDYLFEVFAQFDNNESEKSKYTAMKAKKVKKQQKYFKSLKLMRGTLLENGINSVSGDHYLYLIGQFIDNVKQIRKLILTNKSLNFDKVEEYFGKVQSSKSSCERVYDSKMNFIEEIPKDPSTCAVLKNELNKPKYSKYDVLLSNFKRTIKSSNVEEEYTSLISNYYTTFWYFLKHIFNEATKSSNIFPEILLYGLDCIVFLRDSNERIMNDINPKKKLNYDQKIIEIININKLLGFCDKLVLKMDIKCEIETLFNTKKYYHLLFERSNIDKTQDSVIVHTNLNFNDIKDKIEKILEKNIQRIEYFQIKALFREEVLQELKAFHEKLEIFVQNWLEIEKNPTSLEKKFNDIKVTDALLERRYKEFVENNELDTCNLTATLDFPAVAFEGFHTKAKSFLPDETLLKMKESIFNPDEAETRRVLLIKILEEQIKVQKWEELVSLCFQYYSEKDKEKKQIISDIIQMESEKTSIELQTSLKKSIDEKSNILLTYYIQQRIKLLESNKFDFFGSYQSVKHAIGANSKDINMIKYYHEFEELSKTISHIKSYSEAAISLEPLTFCFSDILILLDPFSLATDISKIIQLEETLNTKLRDHNDQNQIYLANPIEFKASKKIIGGILNLDSEQKILRKISDVLSPRIDSWIRTTLFAFKYPSWLGSLKDIIPLQISILLVIQSVISYCFSFDILRTHNLTYNKAEKLGTELEIILKAQEELFACIFNDCLQISDKVVFDSHGSAKSNFDKKIKVIEKIIANSLKPNFFIGSDTMQLVCVKMVENFTQKIELVEKNIFHARLVIPVFINKCITILKYTNKPLENFWLQLPNFTKVLSYKEDKKVYSGIYQLQYAVKDVEETFSKFSEPNITIDEREEIIQNLIPKVFDVVNAIDDSIKPKKIQELIGNVTEFLVGAILVCIKYFKNNWECKYKAVELKKLLFSNCKDDLTDFLKFNKWKECTIDRNILFPSIINTLNRLSICIIHDYIPNISFILFNLDNELNTLTKSQIRLSYISEQLCDYFWMISCDHTIAKKEKFNLNELCEKFLTITNSSTPGDCLKLCTSNDTNDMTSLWNKFYEAKFSDQTLKKHLKLVTPWINQFTFEIMSVGFQYKVHLLKLKPDISYDFISLLSLISKLGSKKLYTNNNFLHIENSAIKFFHKALLFTLSDVPTKISNFKKMQPNYKQTKSLLNLFDLDDTKIDENCLELQQYTLKNPTSLLRRTFEKWYSCQFDHLEYTPKQMNTCQSLILEDLQNLSVVLAKQINPPILVRFGWRSSSNYNPDFEKEVLDTLHIAYSCGFRAEYNEILKLYTKNFCKLDYSKTNKFLKYYYGTTSKFKILPNYQITCLYKNGPTLYQIGEQEFQLTWHGWKQFSARVCSITEEAKEELTIKDEKQEGDVDKNIQYDRPKQEQNDEKQDASEPRIELVENESSPVLSSDDVEQQQKQQSSEPKIEAIDSSTSAQDAASSLFAKVSDPVQDDEQPTIPSPSFVIGKPVFEQAEEQQQSFEQQDNKKEEKQEQFTNSYVIDEYIIEITPEILVKSLLDGTPCDEFPYITCTASSGPYLFFTQEGKATDDQIKKIEDITSALTLKPDPKKKNQLETQKKKVQELIDIIEKDDEHTLEKILDKICKLMKFNLSTRGLFTPNNYNTTLFEDYLKFLTEKFCDKFLEEAINKNNQDDLHSLLEQRNKLIEYPGLKSFILNEAKGNLISSYQIISQKLKLLSYIQEGKSCLEDSLESFPFKPEDIISLTKALGKLFSKQPVFVVINSQLESIEINFGHNSFESTNPRKTIYIKNGTDKTVSIRWQLENQKIFTSSCFVNNYSIPPGVEIPMVISLNTTQKGTHTQSGSLSILDSNNEEKICMVIFRGIVEVPEIRISEKNITFIPTQTGGKPISMDFQIQNKSDCLVPINIDCPESFSINHDTEFYLTARATKTITISTKQCLETKYIAEILKINYDQHQKKLPIKAKFIKPDFTVLDTKRQKIHNNYTISCTPNVDVPIYIKNNCALNLHFNISTYSSNRSWCVSKGFPTKFEVPLKKETKIKLSGNFSHYNYYSYKDISPTIRIKCDELPHEVFEFNLVKKDTSPKKSLKISEPYEFNYDLCCVAGILSTNHNLTFEKQYLRKCDVHFSENGNQVEILTNDSTTIKVQVWVNITTLHNNILSFAGCKANFKFYQQRINPPNFIRYVSNNMPVLLAPGWKSENFIVPEGTQISDERNSTIIRYTNDMTELNLTYKNGFNIICNKLVPLNRILCVRRIEEETFKCNPLSSLNHHILEKINSSRIWQNIYDCLSKELIGSDEFQTSSSIIHLLYDLTNINISPPKSSSTGIFSYINKIFSSSNVFTEFIDSFIDNSGVKPKLKRNISDGDKFVISAVQTILNYKNDFAMQAMHFGNFMKYNRIVSDTSNFLLKLESNNETSFWHQFIWQMKLLSVTHTNNHLFTNLIPLFDYISNETTLEKGDFIKIGNYIIPEKKKNVFSLLHELVTKQPENWLQLFVEINSKHKQLKQDYLNLKTQKLTFWYNHLDIIFKDTSFNFLQILNPAFGINEVKIMGIDSMNSRKLKKQASDLKKLLEVMYPQEMCRIAEDLINSILNHYKTWFGYNVNLLTTFIYSGYEYKLPININCRFQLLGIVHEILKKTNLYLTYEYHLDEVKKVYNGEKQREEKIFQWMKLHIAYTAKSKEKFSKFIENKTPENLIEAIKSIYKDLQRESWNFNSVISKLDALLQLAKENGSTVQNFSKVMKLNYECNMILHDFNELLTDGLPDFGKILDLELKDDTISFLKILNYLQILKSAKLNLENIFQFMEHLKQFYLQNLSGKLFIESHFHLMNSLILKNNFKNDLFSNFCNIYVITAVHKFSELCDSNQNHKWSFITMLKNEANFDVIRSVFYDTDMEEYEDSEEEICNDILLNDELKNIDSVEESEFNVSDSNGSSDDEDSETDFDTNIDDKTNIEMEEDEETKERNGTLLDLIADKNNVLKKNINQINSFLKKIGTSKSPFISGEVSHSLISSAYFLHFVSYEWHKAFINACELAAKTSDELHQKEIVSVFIQGYHIYSKLRVTQKYLRLYGEHTSKNLLEECFNIFHSAVQNISIDILTDKVKVFVLKLFSDKDRKRFQYQQSKKNKAPMVIYAKINDLNYVKSNSDDANTKLSKKTNSRNTTRKFTQRNHVSKFKQNPLISIKSQLKINLNDDQQYSKRSSNSDDIPNISTSVSGEDILSMTEETTLVHESLMEGSETITGILKLKPNMDTVDFEKIYGRNTKAVSVKDYDLIPLEDVEDLEPETFEMWTYERLARHDIISTHCSKLANEIHQKAIKNPNNVVQVCLLIDNSGSMNFFKKPTVIAEALVIFTETLKRAEIDFAVAKFGSKDSTKVILKSFKKSFSFISGQQILESLKYDEATAPATALARIPEELWPKETPENVKKVIIMLTDGLTNEKIVENYLTPMKTHGFLLHILHLSEGLKSSSFSLLNPLFEEPDIKYYPVPNNTQLPEKLSVALDTIFTSSIISSSHHDHENEIKLQINLNNNFHKSTIEIVKVTDLSQEIIPDTENKILYNISNPSASIDYSIPLANKINNVTNQVSFEDHLKVLRERMDETSITFDYKTWQIFLQENHSLIQSFVSVFEEAMFHSNQFTRYKAASKGSSLHLPGLIKAVTSNYTYKKYFKVKQAGERRNYGVCLILDISLSMRGELSRNAFRSLLLFLASLHQIGIEETFIVLYSETIKIMKTNQHKITDKLLSLLWNQIPNENSSDQKEEYSSNDHNAILCAVELLKQKSSSTKGKKIFVFSDGHSSSPTNVLNCIQYADQNNIEVFGIGTGYETFGFENYSKWITAVMPGELPNAIRNYYSSNFVPKAPENFRSLKLKEENQISIAQVINEGQNHVAFPQLTEMLQSERELRIERGDGALSVDICFTVDVTGSMKAILPSIKSQILTISSGIQSFLKEQFSETPIVIRYAILGYRDFKEYKSKEWIKLDFVEDLNELTSFINSSEFQARGGDDIAEDVLGGLYESCLLSWKSKARYIVLICDAPAHGLHQIENIDDHSKDHPSKLTVESVIDKIKETKSGLIVTQICPNLTNYMVNRFKTYWSQKENEDSLNELQIVNFGGSDNSPVVFHQFHFVFVLDESGSMKSSWNKVQNSFTSFLNLRSSDQSSDIVSVVNFDSVARVIWSRESVGNLRSRTLPFNGNGTNFSVAIEKAFPLIKSQDKYLPVMIFMSDGQGGSVATELLKKANQVGKQFKFYAIAFANNDPVQLKDMVTTLQKNGFHSKLLYSSTDIQLTENFREVAEGSKVTELLQSAVGKQIADAVGLRIALDHL